MGKIKLSELLKILQKFSMDKDRNAKKSQTLIYTDVADVLKQGIIPELFIAIPHTTTINRIFNDNKPTPDDIENTLNTNESYEEKIKRLSNNFEKLEGYNFESIVAEFIASKDQPKNMDKYKFLAQILIKSISEEEFDAKVIANESIVKKRETSPKQDSRNQYMKNRKKIIYIVLLAIFSTNIFYAALNTEELKQYFSQLNMLKVKSAYYDTLDTINIDGIKLKRVIPTVTPSNKYTKDELFKYNLYITEEKGNLEGYSLKVDRNYPKEGILTHFQGDYLAVNDLYNLNEFYDKNSEKKKISISFRINDKKAYRTLNNDVYFQNDLYELSPLNELKNILEVSNDSDIYKTDSSSTIEIKVIYMTNSGKEAFFYLLSKENETYRIIEKRTLEVELF